MEEAKTMTENKMSLSKWQKRAETFALCRAQVLKAVNAKPGMTYTQIREYIRWHFHFTMEQVGARCRELYYSGYARKETDGSGRVHVYPVKEE